MYFLISFHAKFGLILSCSELKINWYLKGPQHPTHDIEKTIAKLNKGDKIKTVFSKSDLNRSYINRRMDDEAQKLTT